MKPAHIQKLKQITAKLEELTKNPNTPQQQPEQKPVSQQKDEPKGYDLFEFENLLSKFYSDSLQIENQGIISITKIAIDVFSDMKKVLNFFKVAKSPNQQQIQRITTIIGDKLKTLNKFYDQSTYPDIKYHVKVIQEGMGIINWLFNKQPKDLIDSSIEACAFNGIKVLQLKQPNHKKWYEDFNQSLMFLKNFINDNFENGLTYNEKTGTDNYEELLAQIANLEPAKEQQVQAKKQTEFDACDELCLKFVQLSDSVQAQQAKLLSNCVKEVYNMSKIIQEASKKLTKPNEEATKQLNSILVGKIKEMNINQLLDKPETKVLAKPIIEGINSFFWVLNDNPKESIESCIESSEFHALTLRKQKIQPQTDWYNGFVAFLKELLKYIISNQVSGLQWNCSGSNDYTQLYSQLKSEEAHQQQEQPKQEPNEKLPAIQILPMQQNTQVQQPLIQLGGQPSQQQDSLLPPMVNEQDMQEFFKKKEEEQQKLNESSNVVQQSSQGSKAALFAQINVGMDKITNNLKHIDRKKFKEENKESTSIENKSVNPDKNIIQTEQKSVQAPPSKAFRDNWYIENFKDDKTITISQSEAEIKHSIFIFNCINSMVTIEAKVNQIFINKCTNLTLVFQTSISGIIVVYGKKIYINCLNQCPSIELNKSEQVSIAFSTNKDCEIIYSHSQEISVQYKKDDGELSDEVYLPYQIKTKWNQEKGRFENQILDVNFG